MLETIIANWVLVTISFILGWVTVDRFRYKKLSEKDLFTNCFNKDWAITRKNSKLVRMMKHTDKRGVPFGLAFIDLDNFKKINDSKGHSVGDELILNTIKAIKKVLSKRRVKGVTVRFGGDEFMILISNTHEEELRVICEDIVFRVKLDTSATVSVGGTIFTKGDAINVKKLVDKADANLYAAKEEGKNFAVVA